jgi:pantoate--beta-alanine ligase
VQIVEAPDEFQRVIESMRLKDKSVGFVPTMGYLHDGHMALVKRSRQENDITAASIFVNPTQFNVSGDLTNYPRDLGRDLDLLENCGADFVFVPSVESIYETDTQNSVVHRVNISVSNINSVFEGAHRPGHFDGVALIILKLFNLVGRCRAYFGLKDYQQVLLIIQLVKELFIPVEVVRCQTVRQSDGLAMSSRNARLNDHQLSLATVLYRSMFDALRLIESGTVRIDALKERITSQISKIEEINLEYVDVVTEGTLETPEFAEGPVRILIAAKLGDVRLIDNLGSEEIFGNEKAMQSAGVAGLKG